MLKDIHSPADLKRLNAAEREKLAAEIRDELVRTVSQTGGHLASNLGAVELTIALHTVFDAPKDKILFDVGHQAYAHKMLTGRFERMNTLRQMDGLSGFPRIDESEYDPNSAGHASDAISLALGLARARDLRGENHSVVAVVGDGALTGGLCFEALNDAGQSKTRLIVVLNDNEMSISRNVGAMSAHLTHMRQSSVYRAFKQSVRNALNRMPRFGNRIMNVLTRMRDSLKLLFINDTFFDSLNVEYIGPIDGHDTREMMRVFEQAKKYDEPVVIHVVTKKGRGYAHAEDHPDRYHGVAPFIIESGETRSSAGSSSGTVAAEELITRARTDGRVMCLSAAMLGGTGMDAFQKEFPDRCIDVGIAEEHEITLSAGLALGGMKPYAAVYSTFLQRAYDHVMMEACLNRAQVTFLIDRAGLNGADGETHQGVFDIAFLRAVPGLVVASPSDTGELRSLIRLSFDVNGPMAIRYPKSLPDSKDVPKLEIGRWIRKREGDSVALVASGRMVSEATHAAEILEKRGVSAAVYDALFIKPFDGEAVSEIADRYSFVVTMEDGVVAGGFGEGIAREICGRNACVKVRNVGVPDRFIPHASVQQQTKLCNMDADSVAALVLDALGKDENARTCG